MRLDPFLLDANNSSASSVYFHELYKYLQYLTWRFIKNGNTFYQNENSNSLMIHKRKKRLSCFSSLSAWKFKPFFQKYEWLRSSNRAAKTLRNHQRIRSQIIMFESSRNLSGRIKCSTSRFTGHSKLYVLIWVIVTKLHKWVSITFFFVFFRYVETFMDSFMTWKSYLKSVVMFLTPIICSWVILLTVDFIQLKHSYFY